MDLEPNTQLMYLAQSLLEQEREADFGMQSLVGSQKQASHI